MFENAPIGIAVADLDGRFVEVNRALCELLGYSEEQLLLTTVQAVTHPHDVGDFLAGTRELLLGEASRFQSEQRYLHADGHPGWALVSVSLLRDSSRQPLHYVLGIDDISASQRNERLRAVTFAVTRRLGEDVDEDGAYRSILQGLCEDLGWDVGQLWICDGDEELHLRDSWYASSPESAEAARVNLEAGTLRGFDLPGRVLADSAPLCTFCGEPLPRGSTRRRRFHDECKVPAWRIRS